MQHKNFSKCSKVAKTPKRAQISSIFRVLENGPKFRKKIRETLAWANTCAHMRHGRARSACGVRYSRGTYSRARDGKREQEHRDRQCPIPRAAVARGEVKTLHLCERLHSLVSRCGGQTSFSDPPAPGLRRAVLRCALAAAGRAAFPVLARALFA